MDSTIIKQVGVTSVTSQLMEVMTQNNYPFMEVSENRGTPSHHPFTDGFSMKSSSHWGSSMAMDTLL